MSRIIVVNPSVAGASLLRLMLPGSLQKCWPHWLKSGNLPLSTL